MTLIRPLSTLVLVLLPLVLLDLVLALAVSSAHWSSAMPGTPPWRASFSPLPFWVLPCLRLWVCSVSWWLSCFCLLSKCVATSLISDESRFYNHTMEPWTLNIQRHDWYQPRPDCMTVICIVWMIHQHLFLWTLHSIFRRLISLKHAWFPCLLQEFIIPKS